MTTNRDIIFGKLQDTVIALHTQGLMTDQEYTFLQDDIEAYVENIEERKATNDQIEWELSHSIKGETC